MSKLLSLATACFESHYVHSKKAFLRAYSSGIASDPELVDHGVYRLLVRTLLEEDPHHFALLESTAYVVKAIMKLRPEWADPRLLEASRSAWDGYAWAHVIRSAFKETRPDLVAAHPEAPATRPVAAAQRSSAQPQ